MVRTIALPACPACGAAEAEDFILGEARLRRCAGCETVYAAEYADPDEVFTDDYMLEEGRFGLDVRHPRFQRFLAEVQAVRLDRLERFRGGSRVLDVGCGTGEFLLAAKVRGWEGVGVEPVAASVEVCRERGLDVRLGLLQDSDVPEREHDLVCLFHVLEHMPDSREFLQMVARWARPGGHVLVEVPNWDSELREVGGERWIHLRPLEHLVQFTPPTLRAALEHAGLEPVEVSTLTYLSKDHSLGEALGNVGLNDWFRWAARLSPTRDLEGTPTKFPSAPMRALVRRQAARLDRAGRGAVVWAVARVR